MMSWMSCKKIIYWMMLWMSCKKIIYWMMSWMSCKKIIYWMMSWMSCCRVVMLIEKHLWLEGKPELKKIIYWMMLWMSCKKIIYWMMSWMSCCRVVMLIEKHLWLEDYLLDDVMNVVLSCCDVDRETLVIIRQTRTWRKLRATGQLVQRYARQKYSLSCSRTLNVRSASMWIQYA
jgi:hypothetical protein